jgi:hypothetical protein
MKRIVLAFVLLGLPGLSCIDPASPLADEPAWIGQMIRDFEAAPVGNPPQSIWKFTYWGSTVYYVPPQCCDGFSDLYDDEGKILCHPDGGLSGAGDGRCPDFRSTAEKRGLVWQDPRTR